jgi:hypothetical protein
LRDYWTRTICKPTSGAGRYFCLRSVLLLITDFPNVFGF